jgi:hypothetical protein
MMTKIYKAIMDRLTEMNPELVAEGFKSVNKLDIWNRQYEEESEGHPLPVRPLLFLEFKEIPVILKAGQKKIETGFILHVVQDCFVDSSNKSKTKDKYLKLLSYPEALEELFDNHFAECLGRLHHVNTIPDHNYKNLIVHKLHFDVTGYKKVKASS